MNKPSKRNIIIVSILSILITFMHIEGWQISMDYGSSVHQSEIFQNIGVLESWQCILWGMIEIPVLAFLFYVLFSRMEKRSIERPAKTINSKADKWIWPLAFVALYAIWLFFLWGCYPGYFNYDAENQLVQVLYDEVQYNAHHPLLHTLFSGGLITLGYRIDSTDLTLGVFIVNAVQMFIVSLCLSYTLRFIYKQTRSWILTGLSFAFFAFCPPVVMFAMSPTKDVLCYTMLLMAFIHLIELINSLEKGDDIKWYRWILIGLFLTLSCLIRKNIIYAIIVFIPFSILLLKKERKKQILLYVTVVIIYLVVDKGLLVTLNAIPGSVNEALCVPYQQIARLYIMEGEDAFTDEEYELLSELVPPEALNCYDPVMGDHTKANFNPGLDTLKANKWTYLKFWIKKGMEYPQIYIDALLYNTYQAWYPGTQITEYRRVRYFDITDWERTYGKPHWQGLFDFYESIRYGEYTKYPVIRLLFVPGTMLWIALVSLFLGVWKKNRSVIVSLLLILLVCCTNFLGPVSDVRYYLILFYAMPVCLAFLFRKEDI